MTTLREYPRGYQDALAEIIAIADVDGSDAAIAYARANQKRAPWIDPWIEQNWQPKP